MTSSYRNVASLDIAKGVRIGNYVEDMASEIVPEMESGSSSQQRFVTTNNANFSPNERYVNDVDLSTLRTDIVLKYGKYGKSHCFSDTKQGIDFGDTPKNELIQARLQRLKEEQTRFQFQTEQHQQARMVGELFQEIRLQAKRSTCYPKSNGGQEAQIGRKPTGDFAREMDKDYNRIGLRKY